MADDYFRDPSDIVVDETLKSELTEGRDLHEHWEDNMPIFNVTPRPRQPKHQTGKSYAARNPTVSPYPVMPWSNKTGAMVMPNVSALALHDVLDLVEARVLAEYPPYADVVPPRQETHWVEDEFGWWPRPVT